MKKNNLKKLGVFALSVISAVTVGVSCLTINNVNAYSYPENNPKNLSYVESLFSVKGNANGISVQGDYQLPSYMGNISANNGVLLTFNNSGLSTGGSYVESSKAYKKEDLSNILTMLPVVDAIDVKEKPYIQVMYVDVVEKDASGNDSKTVSIRLENNYSYYKNGMIGLTVAGKDGAVAQDYAGYALMDASWGAPAELTNTLYYRGLVRGSVVQNTGLAGGYNNVSFGYVQDGDKVAVTSDKATYFDGQENVIRQLNKNVTKDLGLDYNNYEARFCVLSQDDPLFNGFSENANLYIRIKVEALTNENTPAKIFLSNLAGESLSMAVRGEADYKGIVNKAFKIPTPKAYIDAENSSKESEFVGSYQITKVPQGSNAKMNEKQAFTSGLTFTPDKAGEYVISYFNKDVNDNYYEGTITVTVEESATLNVTPTNKNLGEKDQIRGTEINVGANATSSIYNYRYRDGSLVKDNTSCSVTVEYYGDSYSNAKEIESVYDKVTKDFMHKILKDGKYRIVYTAKDEVGNESSTYQEFNSIHTYSALTIAKDYVWVYGNEDSEIKVDRNIVKFYNSLYGNNFFGQGDAVATMTVKTPSNQTQTWNGVEPYEFSEGVYGVYEFTYIVNYKENGVQYTIPENGVPYTFTVNVIDGCSPKLVLRGADYLIGASNLGEANGTINYKANVQDVVNFGKLQAYDEVGAKYDYTEDIKVAVFYNNGKTIVKTDLSNEFSVKNLTGEFTYKFENVGEYRFSISVSDGYNSSNVLLAVNVKTDWYEFSGIKEPNESYTTLDVLNIKDFDVINSKGESVQATKKVEFYTLGELVGSVTGNATYNPKTSGDYIIKYVAQVNGETVSKEFTFSVKDKTAPTLEVKQTVQVFGVINQSVKIPTFTAEDIESSTRTTIKVVYNEGNKNEELINVYNNQFIPEKEGAYAVYLVAEDTNGNVTTYRYTVEVNKSNVSFPIVGVICGVLGLGLIAVALTFILKKKKQVNIDE